MSEKKHTAGNWYIYEPYTPAAAGEDYTITTNKKLPGKWRGYVASVLCSSPNAIENARLIAAAPELLSALEGVLRVADRQTDEFDAARAAIAKATGAP